MDELGSERPPLEEIQREAEHISNKFHNLGYREGFFQGKSETLQQAFDAGFYYGALKALQEPSTEHVRKADPPPSIPTLEAIEAEHKAFAASIKHRMSCRPG